MLLKQTLIALTMLCFCAIAFAFNPEEANKGLDKLSVTLSTQELSSKELEKIQKDLLEKKKLADQCVEEKSKELSEINEQLPEVKPKESITLTADQQFLLKKRQEINQVLSGCKLYSFRAAELLNAFGKEAKAAKRSFYLTRSDPTYKYIKAAPKAIISWIDSFDKDKIMANFALSSYNAVDVLFIALMISFAYLSSIYLKGSAIATATSVKEKTKFERYGTHFLRLLRRKATLLVLLIALLVYEVVHDYFNNYDLFYDKIILPILFYTFAQVVIRFFTTAPFASDHFSGKKKKEIRKLRGSLGLLIVVFLISFFVRKFSLMLPENDIIWKLSQALYYSAITIVFASIVSNYLRLSRFFTERSSFQISILVFNFIFLIVVLTALWDGYEPLALYILNGVVLSALSIIVTLLLYLTAIACLESFILQQYPWQKKAFKLFNLSQNALVLEFVTLKLTFFLLLWGGLIIYLNSLWSISDIWSLTFREYILDGFVVADFKIQPLRIVLALAFFSFSMLMIKLIKHQIQPKDTAINKPAQEAYVIIIGYIAVGLGLLVSLMIAGVNMHGLAIIAGALSFGIGFGLQNIVNNFISGLVLLLERPVKKGDRIVVGENEGFVTNVGVRSTKIQLLEHSHIIVPNSDLVTKEVKNFMINNKRFRLMIEIAVKYNSSANKIKELLLQVANSHDEVLKESPYEPLVFCMGYSDSALNFRLWCSIDNVNNKWIVRSDLYFMVDEILRENNIDYAFTQAEIQLKQPPELPNSE